MWRSRLYSADSKALHPTRAAGTYCPFQSQDLVTRRLEMSFLLITNLKSDVVRSYYRSVAYVDLRNKFQLTKKHIEKYMNGTEKSFLR